MKMPVHVVVCIMMLFVGMLFPTHSDAKVPIEAVMTIEEAELLVTPRMRCVVCVLAFGMYQRGYVELDGLIPPIPVHLAGLETGRLPLELAADEVVPALWPLLADDETADMEPELLCSQLLGFCPADMKARLWAHEDRTAFVDRSSLPGGRIVKMKNRPFMKTVWEMLVEDAVRKTEEEIEESQYSHILNAARRQGMEFPPGTNCDDIRYPDVGDHLPVCDDDFDKFSSYRTLRGYQWRGRDCNDKNGLIYPGRATSSYDASVDHDCNGIYGTDANTSLSYEELYCSNSTRRGVIALGDSLSAVFMIPINNWELGDYMIMAFGEAGFPQCSWNSGFVEDKDQWCARENPLPLDPIDSIYLRLKQRNLCNHRDYQDHSWLGARSPSQLNYIANIARNKDDHPSLVLYSMFANDICNSAMDYSKCTTPESFDSNIRGVLSYLNETVPAGSQVVLIGHMQGEIIWDTLSNVFHPILRSLTYGFIFQFVAELDISPCAGWLNNDAEIRAGHTEWAESLDAVCQNIAAVGGYENLNINYIQNPMYKVFDAYTGPNEKKDLFTYVDGGHWNIEMETLFGRQVWNELETQFGAEVLGPVNPNNAAIAARFGDQGNH